MAFKDHWEHHDDLRRCLYLIFIFFMITWNVAGSGECTELFRTHSFVLEGRTLAVFPVDLDIQGPAEIIVITKTGTYPSERRWISIFSADDTFTYGPTPGQQWEMDRSATLFDVGDVASSPGKEIFFLTSQGIQYYARQSDGRFSSVSHSLLEMSTATVFPAAGSVPRVRLLADWHNSGRQTLLVPQFDSFVLFSRNEAGTWHPAQNISIFPRSFLYGDQEDDGISRGFSLRMDYRFPTIFTRDFNGDGRADLLLTEQESVLIYPQASNGCFARDPAASIQLPGRPEGKAPDWDSSFLAIPAEINGDGFVDMILILSSGTGRFLERKVTVFLFFNRKVPDRPFPDKADQTITFFGITPGVSVVDINKDGLQDLLFSNIELGFWNTVKNLISKRVDVHTSIYLLQNNHYFPAEPDFYTQTQYQLDLTHGISFNGIWPTLEGDFNGDGYSDLLIAKDGKLIVYQTSPHQALFSNSYHQADVITGPFKHITDLDRDGLDDLILYEKKENGVVSIFLNKGQWEDPPYDHKSTIKVNGK